MRAGRARFPLNHVTPRPRAEQNPIMAEDMDVQTVVQILTGTDPAGAGALIAPRGVLVHPPLSLGLAAGDVQLPLQVRISPAGVSDPDDAEVIDVEALHLSRTPGPPLVLLDLAESSRHATVGLWQLSPEHEHVRRLHHVATDPAPTDPAPTDPAPTDPAPTDPAPTDPAPTDPAPTDPASTDPSGTAPPATGEPDAAPAGPDGGQPPFGHGEPMIPWCRIWPHCWMCRHSTTRQTT